MTSSSLSSASSAVSIPPTRLRLPNLLCANDRYAAGVLDGRFDHLLPAGGLPTDLRWYTRLHTDDELDGWLISWAAGHTTELHDHGGSLGALTFLAGVLDEYRWNGTTLRRRRLEAGDQAAFGCQDWLALQVTTVTELEDALDDVDAHDGAAYIEVMIPDEESQPLPEEVIDRCYKLRTPGSSSRR